ncbi:unnamed protein product [Mucor hiemalis]
MSMIFILTLPTFSEFTSKIRSSFVWVYFLEMVKIKVKVHFFITVKRVNTIQVTMKKIMLEYSLQKPKVYEDKKLTHLSITLHKVHLRQPSKLNTSHIVYKIVY